MSDEIRVRLWSMAALIAGAYCMALAHGWLTGIGVGLLVWAGMPVQEVPRGGKLGDE